MRFTKIGSNNPTEQNDNSNHYELENIDVNKRNEWIKKMVDSLDGLVNVDNFDSVEPSVYDLPDFKKISYRINKTGRILLGDKSQPILICILSWHDNKEIGDISVALTYDREVYVNKGHVCGNIIHFQHMSTIVPKTANDFFTYFVSDVSGIRWEKWHHKTQN